MFLRRRPGSSASSKVGKRRWYSPCSLVRLPTVSGNSIYGASCIKMMTTMTTMTMMTMTMIPLTHLCLWSLCFQLVRREHPPRQAGRRRQPLSRRARPQDQRVLVDTLGASGSSAPARLAGRSGGGVSRGGYSTPPLHWSPAIGDGIQPYQNMEHIKKGYIPGYIPAGYVRSRTHKLCDLSRKRQITNT